MRTSIRHIVSALFFTTFLLGCFLMGRYQYDLHQMKLHTQAAKQLVTTNAAEESTADTTFAVTETPDSTDSPKDAEEGLPEAHTFLYDINLAPLQEINPHIIGWVCIPNTSINYPLLQYEDNETGLTTAWDGSSNQAGCIFLECESSPDFQDFNTIVYGHNMRDSSMFGSLKGYEEQSYLEEHPLFYLVTPTQILCYEIFSALESSITSEIYRLSVEEAQKKKEILQFSKENSWITSSLSPTEHDRILTLSTCTRDSSPTRRWVVQAVLTGTFEKISNF